MAEQYERSVDVREQQRGRCLRSCRDGLFTLDQDAAFEAGAVADKGDGAGCGDRPPAGQCGPGELEDHRQGGSQAAAPRVTQPLNVTMLKMDSIGSVVHRCTQSSLTDHSADRMVCKGRCVDAGTTPKIPG